MSDDDLIRRGDAVLAITAADKECLGAEGSREFIRCLPASPEVAALIRDAVQAERERCARIADRYANEGQWVDGFIMAADIALAIRAASAEGGE